MPKPPKVSGTIKEWYFDQRHNLCGYIYGDTRTNPCVDGDYVRVVLINYVVEYKDHWLVRTAANVYFELVKDESNGTKPEHNALVLAKYSRRRDETCTTSSNPKNQPS